MSNWFGKGNRGFILGLWACCQPIGNIVGSMLSAAVLPSGYQNAFLLQSVLIVIGGFVIFFGISSHPHMGDLPAYTEIVDDSRVTAVNSSTRVVRSDEEDAELLEKRPPPIGFVSAILLPSVLAYCLCNACLKLVNYAFFFWLPLYLNGKYHLPEKDAVQLSIWYDAGGAVSSVLGGYISDRIGCRSPVIVILLTASLGALFGYSQMPPGQAWNAVVMSLVGLCISGPYNLIVGTISADLGSQPALMGNAQALSTVSGLVDGTGSAGSAIGQLIVPLINNNYGWDYVFYMFIVMNFLAVVCLLNRFVLDMRQLFDNYRRRRHEDTEPLLNDQGHNDYSAISPD
uniref:Major facilitator superfamily (MFS) profile domain-containing protein n=1 Tax=Plectus sambesii TaxID=2011161 RepID=A0A914W7V4_9BILA